MHIGPNTPCAGWVLGMALRRQAVAAGAGVDQLAVPLPVLALGVDGGCYVFARTTAGVGQATGEWEPGGPG